MTNEKSGVDDGRTRITITNMIAAHSDFKQVINSWDEIAVPIIKNINATMSYMSEVIERFNASEFMTYMTKTVASLCEEIQAAKDNPTSVINFAEYQEKLKVFLWAWPYEIIPAELKKLLEQSRDEKDFDRIMLSFFSKRRMKDMFAYIIDNIPKKHKKIFVQIERAYYQGLYALINNATLSILDNVLSESLKNKGCVTRIGILHPIIDFYDQNYCLQRIPFIIEMQMLSNSIDLIFANYSFSGVIRLESNKTVRRHLSLHGVKYSNKRIDSVMVINTLASFLKNRPYIEPFKNSLKYNSKEKVFGIGLKSYALKNRICKQLNIE